MFTLKIAPLHLVLTLFAFGLFFGGVGCGFSGTPYGAVVGRAGLYDYSPTMIQSGDLQQFWWCGQGQNPEKPSQDTDSILYESIDTSTRVIYGPVVVLGETPGKWDSAYVCNPRVIRGSFSNPLGDGQTYAYAMYYVGTAQINGTNNSIGVAFSQDGIAWKKYPNPIILSTSTTAYGVGQPAAYNSDQKQAIWMFYEDNTPTIHRLEAMSSDGLHFATKGTLTASGLDPNNPQPTWGDIAYDPSTKSWYAVFNLPIRPSASTDLIQERGQYGVQLYRIDSASLLTGVTPWQQLKTVDTNSTGYECNFIAGLLHDPYGNINIGPYPAIQIYPTISNPPPDWKATPAAAGESCRISSWDIGSAEWTPGGSPLALQRYYNGKVHEVTTGWVDPYGGFLNESTLGHLYEAPQNGATLPLYGCKAGSTDYFISRDPLCEGARILGLNGYAYPTPVAAMNLVPLYRCKSSRDHFASKDPKCEGQATEQLLGYVLP